MRKIDQIQEQIDAAQKGDNPWPDWILINPKTERELFLDGSLKKSDNIDDHILVYDEGGNLSKIKTVITTKTEDFTLLSSV